MRLVTAIVHFNHVILVYEDDKKVRSCKLFDSHAKFIKDYPVTFNEKGRPVAGDIAAAMKHAKAIDLADQADKRLAEAVAE